MWYDLTIFTKGGINMINNNMNIHQIRLEEMLGE